jgi:hypothetical protein
MNKNINNTNIAIGMYISNIIFIYLIRAKKYDTQLISSSLFL